MFKLDASNGNVSWSRLLGSEGNDRSFDVSVDAAGDIYIAGRTESTTFEGLTNSGGREGFVAKLNAADGTTAWAKLLGEASDDDAQRISIDTDGNNYVTGYTASATFEGETNNGADDTFVVKLSASNGELVWTKLLGGSGIESGFGISADANGNVYAVGVTNSTSFAGQSKSGDNDAYVVNLVNAVFNVIFETDGGSDLTTQIVEHGTAATEPEAPTKQGYTFAGWYSDTSFTTAYDFATLVTEEITLYAQWAFVPAEAGSVVYYADEDGNILQEVEVLTGSLGETWTTEAIVIEGYTFVRVEGSESGAFTEENQTVVYIYSKNDIPTPELPGTGVSSGHTEIFLMATGSLIVAMGFIVRKKFKEEE